MYPNLPAFREETISQNLLLSTTAAAAQDSSMLHSLSEVAKEMKKLYTIAFPMIIAGLLVYGKSAISMFFMGCLGKAALASGSLSIGLANITGFSLISGLSMGMDAITSQAYGANNHLLVAQTLHRTTAILVAASIPVSILWINIEPFLLAAGQDPSISSSASTYLLFSIPSLLFQSVINPLKIYLRVQNLTTILMAAAGISLLLHPPVNYCLVYHFGLGIRGVALSSAIADFVFLVTILVIYLASSKSWGCFFLVSTFSSFFHQCFMGWKPILVLAIPSCISVCLEWWWYELMIVLSGLLPDAAESVSTMGIMIQATSLVYIFPSSLSLAVSTRVGFELGANRPDNARTSAHVAFACAVFTSFVASSTMIILRGEWGRTFTSDEKIMRLTVAALPIVGLCELGNCPQTTVCGVLRGSARPGLGANINLCSFYGVGLPMALFLAFVMKMGFMGLWLGLLAAQITCLTSMVIVAGRTDWEEEADKAQRLIGNAVDPEIDDNALPVSAKLLV